MSPKWGSLTKISILFSQGIIKLPFKLPFVADNLLKKDQSRIIKFIDQMNGIQVTNFHNRSTDPLNIIIESAHGLNQSSKQDDQSFISILDYPWRVGWN